MAMEKKIVIGITSESSVSLISGQMSYFKSIGYKMYLLSPYSERVEKFCKLEGCEHLEINIERDISPLKDFKTFIQIYRILKVVKPDIVNFGTPKVSLLGISVSFILGVKKRIYTCRGFRFEHESGFKKFILVLMEKITVYFSHKVICISASVQELGFRNSIFSSNKSVVINKGSSNGINLNLFDRLSITKESTHDILKKYNLSGRFVFGFIGRIVDRKGISELLDAFDILFNSHQNLSLLLIGPFEHSQLKDTKIVERIKMHQGISYVGSVAQDEIPNYLAVMNVFVLPAWWEGFGNVLIQAAAMGVPVISTDATGTKDAVSNDFNGLLVPVKDVVALKNAMMLLMNDGELRKKMGENGVIWSKNFESENLWQSMNSIYLE